MPDKAGARPRPLLARIGPGLITACVVIGPGSILTSSKVGAASGYSMSWVVVVAVACMLVYMQLGAKLGVATSGTTGDVIRDRAGRWLAVAIGASVFFIASAFQFGNNLGVQSAFAVYLPGRWATAVMVAFNGLSIAFLFGFRNLYRAVERMMMVFVGVMLVSFAANLWAAGPNVKALLYGFIPRIAGSRDDLAVLGLIGTTFVVTAAYFQSYLVRQKGWDVDSMRDGMIDARIGAVVMAGITLMIMTTAGTVLHGRELRGVGDVAQQLEPLFGRFGQALFCLGLFSAAYSSFLVNSMIGGFILADGLGWGRTKDDRASRFFTAAVLVVGMLVALAAIATGSAPVPAIVAAQAVTVVLSPLIAGLLWYLTSSRTVMGALRNGPITHVLAGVGFVLLLAIAAYTATVKIPQRWRAWQAPARPSARLGAPGGPVTMTGAPVGHASGPSEYRGRHTSLRP